MIHSKESLDALVIDYRTQSESIIDKTRNKIGNVVRYLNKHNIRDVVLGVSGGIDSAVVLGLMVACKKHIPDLQIRTFCINFDIYDDVFEQQYVEDLEAAYKKHTMLQFVDGTASLNRLFLDLGVPIDDHHLAAQSSYALRYQMLFTFAQFYGSVTLGTTNRDEFEYAGWFGKNSDMVVDIQPIADWHKFEVRAAAKVFGVPQSIIDRAPCGDLIDASTDEFNFGCTYDELSYFTDYVKRGGEITPFLEEYFSKLIALHAQNAHKYQGQTFNPVFI